MAFPPLEIQQLVAEIAAILRNRNQTLAISEAACGGLLSAYIVSVNGALDFYIGGKLVYLMKQRLKLSGLLDSEISSYMGPLEQVVLRLARTAKYELGSTYVLSETGFAGPTTDLHLRRDNDSVSVPVGTVYLGISGPEGEKSMSWATGNVVRSENMEAFAKRGLEFFLDHLRLQT
ncbi:hypothetical protein PUMCH_000670 [Australozyma saopauloensis]|uniref:CinA C-terminal domain-containing protein n=1 Tax=Australozyma saopauloensis TaxID=291208 RepID=A0AAX4H6N7_9ASCO|nr:hypothetical protein PUMCH_000670 [[Candida] saopauloensis]